MARLPCSSLEKIFRRDIYIYIYIHIYIYMYTDLHEGQDSTPRTWKALSCHWTSQPSGASRTGSAGQQPSIRGPGGAGRGYEPGVAKLWRQFPCKWQWFLMVSEWCELDFMHRGVCSQNSGNLVGERGVFPFASECNCQVTSRIAS